MYIILLMGWYCQIQNWRLLQSAKRKNQRSQPWKQELIHIRRTARSTNRELDKKEAKVIG